MRSKEMRELSTNLLAWTSSFLHRRDKNAIRDPTIDCRNGVLIFWLLEELTGGKIARYNENALSDRAIVENLSILCLALKKLDVQPVGDGGWTPGLLANENHAAWWSLLVALALRFNCDRPIKPGVFLATVLKTYKGKSELPISEKTVRTILTPSEEEMTNLRRAYAEKYGFTVAEPVQIIEGEMHAELVKWANSYLAQRGVSISTAEKRLFGEGIKLIILLETLTGMTIEQVLGEPMIDPVSEEQEARKNIGMAFGFMESIGIDHHNTTLDDVMDGAPQPILRLLADLRGFDFTSIQGSALDAVAALHEDESFVESQRAAVAAQMKASAAAGSSDVAATIAAAAAAGAEADEPPADAPPMYADMEDPDGEFAPDVFDRLFAADVAKLDVVKNSMLTFVNARLSQVNLSVSDLSSDFVDGVLLVALVSLCANKYIDAKFYNTTPNSNMQKLDNHRFVIARVRELGLDIPQVSSAKLLAGDLKTVLRLLYVLHRKYR